MVVHLEAFSSSSSSFQRARFERQLPGPTQLQVFRFDLQIDRNLQGSTAKAVPGVGGVSVLGNEEDRGGSTMSPHSLCEHWGGAT